MKIIASIAEIPSTSCREALQKLAEDAERIAANLRAFYHPGALQPANIYICSENDYLFKDDYGDARVSVTKYKLAIVYRLVEETAAVSFWMVQQGSVAGAVAVYASVSSKDSDDEITNTGELHYDLYFMGIEDKQKRRVAYGHDLSYLSSSEYVELTRMIDEWKICDERLAVFNRILSSPSMAQNARASRCTGCGRNPREESHRPDCDSDGARTIAKHIIDSEV